MVREYLQLTRAHTVPQEALPAILASAVAVGGLYKWEVVLGGVFGILYHLAGYGHNSVSDWKNGYDKNDPYKSHHPLNSGKLDISRAKASVYAVMAATVLVTLVMAYGSWLSLIVVLVGIGTGVYYNEYGKSTALKPIPISIAHSTTFAFPFIAFGGNIFSYEFLFGVVFVFVWVMFQIAVSGEVLGIMNDEENVLLSLGSVTKRDALLKHNKHMILSMKAHLMASMLLTAPFAIIVFYGTQIEYGLHIWAAVLFSLASIAIGAQIYEDGAYNRSDRMKYISGREAMMQFSIITVFVPIIGVMGAIILCTGSVLWVIGGNRVIWGTYISPKV